MYIEEFAQILEKYAPLRYSADFMAAGHKDNSGLLVKCGDEVTRALFSLDLTEKTLEQAKKLKCDTFVTHHPVIYTSISRLIKDGENGALLGAIRSGMNIFSMHLNLDIADGGIDDTIARGVGGTVLETAEKISGENGYGKVYTIPQQTFSELVKHCRDEFRSKRVIAYGNGKETVQSAVSFAGGGSASALAFEGSADVCVTSDIPHHIIKALTEKGRKIIVIPHYAAENYGFRTFYEKITAEVFEKAETFFAEDSRFM